METGRPDVLGYPSPTTSRYLLFAVALISSGLFVGNWVHTQTVGDEWLEVIRSCQEKFPTGLGQQIDLDPDSQAALRNNVDCTAAVERERSAFSLGGAGAVLLGALILLYVAPYVVRRRRGLRALGPRLEGAQQRFGELAAEAGVARRVQPLLGTTRQRDAFSFGAPGRQFVALPPAVALRWRQPALFDPLVRHELAHVRHRDVSLAWLTKSVWLAFVPLLGLPVVIGGLGDDPSLLRGYVPRALLLAGVVALLSAELLRSREHVADLRAAQLGGDWRPVAELVAGARFKGRARPLARHPDPRERAEVLERPVRLVHTGFVEGLSAGFLAALTVPLLVAAVSPALTSFGQTDKANVLGACLLGPVLAGSVGLGVWRAAWFARLVGAPELFLSTAVGVTLGVLLGEAASLQQSGTDSLVGLDSPLWMAVTAVAVGGATLLSNAMACLWADHAPLLGRRSSWMLALAVNAVLFAAVLWTGREFLIPAEGLGWPGVRAVLTTTLANRTMQVVTLALAVAALVPLIVSDRGRQAPAWLVEQGQLTWPQAPRLGVGLPLLVGAAAGLAGGAAIVGFRLYVGASDSDDEVFIRLIAYWWVGAIASAVCLLVLGLLRGIRGLASGLVAGPVAALFVAIVFWLLNVALGGPFLWQGVDEFARISIVLGLYLALASILLAGLFLAAARSIPAIPALSTSRAVWLIPATSVLSVALAVPAIAAREQLAGATPDSDPVANLGLGSTVELDRAAEMAAYVSEQALPIEESLTRLEETGFAIDGDFTLDGLTRAALLEQEVVAPMGALLAGAQEYQTEFAELRLVHDEAIEMLAAAVTFWQGVAAAHTTGDAGAFEAAQEPRRAELEHHDAWLASLNALISELGIAVD